MVIDLIRDFVEAGQIIFDVGANIGQKADFFIGIGAKVVCFEPQPQSRIAHILTEQWRLKTKLYQMQME